MKKTLTIDIPRNSPISPHGLQNIDFYESPRNFIPRTSSEAGVSYFYYSAEQSSCELSLDARLRKLFTELIQNRKKQLTKFKITFDIEDTKDSDLTFTNELHEVFYRALPEIDLIEITGSKGIVFLHSLLGLRDDAPSSYQSFLLDSSLRLSIQKSMERREVNLFKQMITNLLKVNPGVITTLSLHDQLFSQETWEELLESLNVTGANIILGLSKCSWQQYVANLDNDIIPQDHPISNSNILSLLVSRLPAQISELNMQHTSLELGHLVRNIDFSEACQNYSQRFGRPLKLSLSQKALNGLNLLDLHMLIFFSNNNLLDIGSIFTQVPQQLLIDYIWEMNSYEYYNDWLSLLNLGSKLCLTNLPPDHSAFSLFISALPNHVNTLAIKLASVDLSQLLSDEFVNSLLERRRDELFWIDLSQTPTTVSHEEQVIQRMNTLIRNGIGFKGITDSKLCSCIVSRALLQDPQNFESWDSAIKQELYLVIPPQQLASYFHPDSLKKCLSIPHTVHAFLSDKDNFLFQALASVSSKYLKPVLNNICENEHTEIDWSKPLFYQTQLALFLWDYAVSKQKCPLSLKAPYLQRMLTEGFNPSVQTARYGLAQVSFAALPQIIVDSLLQSDKIAIEHILSHWYHSLAQLKDVTYSDIIHPFLICESHDPTELVRNQETDRKEAQIDVSAITRPIVLSQNSKKIELQFKPRIYY